MTFGINRPGLYLRDENLKTFTVMAHKNEIKKGDKIILWLAANATRGSKYNWKEY